MTTALLLVLLVSPDEVSVKALMDRARAQAARHDNAGARATLRQALDRAPNAESVLSAWAQVSLSARAPVDALLALEPLTRMCPSVASYHYLRGVALLQAGDSPAATESLQEAARLDPGKPLTLVALGLALNARKMYAEAQPALLQALELAPDDTAALAALAEAEEGLGDLGDAETHATRVLVAVPANATAHLVLGLVRMRQARHAEARDALLRAVEADPDSSRAQYQLSLAFSRLGDEAQAAVHRESYQRRLRETESRIRALRQGGALPVVPEEEHR